MSPSGSCVVADTADNAASRTYFSHFAARISGVVDAPMPPAAAAARIALTRGDGSPPAHSPKTMLRGPLATTTPGARIAAKM